MSQILFLKSTTESASVNAGSLSHMKYDSAGVIVLLFSISIAGKAGTIEIKLNTETKQEQQALIDLTNLLKSKSIVVFSNIATDSSERLYNNKAVTRPASMPSKNITSIESITYIEDPVTAQVGPQGPTGADGADAADDKVFLDIRADEALAKGDPLYITGYNQGQSRITVAKADASDSSKMPSIGLSSAAYSTNDNGRAITVGSFVDVDTSSFSVGDVLYVASGGGLTATKPTGTNLIQNVGKVGRSNVNNGEIVVMAIGRSNDVPNIPDGQTWIGNASGVATPTTLADVATSGAYSDLSGTPTIPVSGVDFDPVGTDNSTDVTLAGTYDYLTLSGQQITLGQVDYSTDISNKPSIPVSGVDFDPVGTDNSTDATVGATASDVLKVTAGQVLGAFDAGVDKLVFWDDSESKLTYATIGTNLTMTSATLDASGGGGSANMVQDFNAPTSTGEFQDGARLVADAYGTAPSATAGTLVNFGNTAPSLVGAQSVVAAATGMLTVVTDAASGDELLVEGVIKMSSNTGWSTDKKGAPLYMSTTAGAVTTTAPSTAGEFVRVVGHVVDGSNSTIYFNPSRDWIELS